MYFETDFNRPAFQIPEIQRNRLGFKTQDRGGLEAVVMTVVTGVTAWKVEATQNGPPYR